MRIPLFMMMRAAKSRPGLNAEGFADVVHSPILTVERLRDLGRNAWLFYWEKPQGVVAIDAMVARICRGKFMRYQEVAALRERLADRIYESSTQRSLYKNRHCEVADCGNDYLAGIFFNGELVRNDYRKTWIKIEEAPHSWCKWCGKKFWPKFEIEEGRKYHCGSRSCRHIEHLRNESQSRGGIDLTPRQRQSIPRQNWDTQRVANYLLRLSNEQRKRARHPSSRAVERRIARCAV